MGDTMKQKLTHAIRLRLDQELDKDLAALALRRGEAKSELCRRLLRQALDQENANDSVDALLKTVRKSMQDVLKPLEERLAKINAKTAVAAATAMYTNAEVLGQMGKDIKTLHEISRKKAVAFVKMPNDRLLDE